MRFGYEKGHEIIHDFNAKAKAGQKIAIVGPTGCGKTTLARLIMRYADPQAGSIRIGGTDIRSLPEGELMKLVSIVFQDAYLFDDSVAENIRMGRFDASDEEVEQAARTAGCHDFISRKATRPASATSADGSPAARNSASPLPAPF